MESYSFEHVLTRDAAYQALLSHNRRLLHTQAAELLAAEIVVGSAEEWSLLPLLFHHQMSAEQFGPAHRTACRMLKLLANAMRHDGWESWLGRALESWSLASGDPPATEGEFPSSVHLLLAVNERNWRQGNYAEAGRLATRALELAQQEADLMQCSAAMRALAVLAHDQGRLDEAQRWHEASIGILEEHGLADDASRAFTVMNLGLLHDDHGRSTEALAHYEQALNLFRGIGDLRGQCYALNNIGCLHCDAGRLDEAGACFAEGLAMCRRLGDRRGEGQILTSQGIVRSERGLHLEALELGRRALFISRELGDRRGEAYALASIGAFELSAGNPEAAGEMYRRALSIRNEIGDSEGAAKVQRQLDSLLQSEPKQG